MIRLKRRLPPFELGLLASLLFHLAVWRALTWKDKFEWMGEPDAMEIDLTRPFRIVTDPRLVRRAENPGVGAPMLEKPKPIQGAPAPKAPEWVLPGPKTQEILPPPPERPEGIGGTGTEEGGLGGLGQGTGSGEVDLVNVRIPRLLNRDELLRNLRRFYPEEERRAGREGQVTLDVHIDRSGKVSSADIIESEGAAFDEAAKRVIRECRFSPAISLADGAPVPVKIRQTIAFLLDE